MRISHITSVTAGTLASCSSPIGLERILTACIEQNNDENGFWMPANIAPFQVLVTPTNTEKEKIKTGAEEIAKALEAVGIDVLLDSRDERPGVKFKDADLVGIPYRINVGKKLAEGQVEVFTRSTSTKVDVGVDAVVQNIEQKLTLEQTGPSIKDVGSRNPQQFSSSS